jgi:VCBS repeat-containing protein
MASVAQISDIKGLVTQEGDLEEILKNRDPISDHGGLLTISGIAKVLFEDKAPEEIDGPVQFSTDFSFFEDGFDWNEVAVDVASFDMFTNEFGGEEEELLNSNLEDPNALAGEVDTEQLDTGLAEFEPVIEERGGSNDDEESPALATDETEETPVAIAESAVPEESVAQTTENADSETPIATEEPETPKDKESPKDESEISEPTPLIGAITLEDISIPEGSKEATISAFVDTPPATDLTITLSNGATIIIKAGESTGVSTPFAIQEDDLVIDPEEYELSIKETSGGGYDSLDSSDTALVEVTDTIDTVYVKVVGSDSVDESSGESLEHKVVLVDKDGEPVTVPEGESVTVSLAYSDEENLDSDDFESSRVLEVTIEGGQSEVAISNEVSDDFFDEGSESYTLGIAAVGGENSFESVEISPEEVTGSIVDSDSLSALNDEATATETGYEYLASEDESDDGQSASGNIIDTDSASNGLEMSLVEVKVDDTVYTLPEDDSNISIKGNYGTLSINSSGAYTYSVDESLTDSWNIGDEGAESFSYTITDGYNQASASLEITVEGRDDAPEITSITGNDRATHRVEGVLDLDGDGNGDSVTPEELLARDKGITFTSDNGDFRLDMGEGNSSMSVDYYGGMAGHKNIVGFYEKDSEGNITDVKIIYTDKGDMDGDNKNNDHFESGVNLGTLNNLNGEVGFFIIPNGYSTQDIANAVDSGYIPSIDSDNKVVFSNPNDGSETVSTNKVFYTNNDMSTDGKDHAVVTTNEDGSLTIGIEDLSLGDQDYDDVVLTIKPCESLGGGSDYFVDLGNISENAQQYGWDTDNNKASWENVDSRGQGVSIYALDFDGEYIDLLEENNYQLGVEGVRSEGNQVPTQLHYDEDTDKSQAIVMEFEGNLNHAEFKFTRLIESEGEQGHYTLFKDGAKVGEGDLNGSGQGNNPTFTIDTDTVVFDKIVFTAIQYEDGANDRGHDSSDYYIQSFQGSGPAWANGGDNILRDIELSDVDDANLEGATVTLKNFKDGDELKAENLPEGIEASIEDGVVTLSGSASMQKYEEALESISFTSTSEDRSVREFEFVVYDGDKHSAPKEVSVDIGGCEINTYTPPVYLKISQDDIAAEGDELTHKIELVYEDGSPAIVPDGESVTISLNYANHNDNKDHHWDDKTDKKDFDTLTKEVTIEGGSSSATFTNKTAYNSGNEKDEYYEVSIDSVSQNVFGNLQIEGSAKGTIIDYDLKEKEDDNNTKAEGEFDIKLFDSDDALFINGQDSGDTFASIKISNIPDDVVLKDNSGDKVDVDNGEVTISANDYSLEDIRGFTITPPKDSSTNFKLNYEVSGENGVTDSFSSTIDLQEVVDAADTQGDMDYTGLEGGWIDLSGLHAKITETNENYKSEVVEKVTIDVDQNQKVIYSYKDENNQEHTSSATKGAFEVPVEHLGTLKVKTADEDFNGELTFKMKTTIRDTDEDFNGSNYKNWNSDWTTKTDTLTVTITGSADAPEIVALRSEGGLEDAGRDPDTGVINSNPEGIPLELSAKTDFGSEDIEFIISDIPEDAYLYDKNGNQLQTNTDPIYDNDGTTLLYEAGTAVVISLAQAEGLTIVPPHDSNVDFDLTVVAKGTESSYDSNQGGVQTNFGDPQTLTVTLEGVVDSPVIETSTTGGNEDEWISFGLKIASGEEQHFSETLYATLEGIPKDAEIRVVDANGDVLSLKDSGMTLAGVNSDTTDWRLDNELLVALEDGSKDLQILPAKDFSGELEFGLEVTAREDDGDSTSVRETFTLDVNPVVDTAGGNDTQVVQEDTWTKLDLPWSTADSNSESIESASITIPSGIQVKVADGEAFTSDGSEITLYINDKVEILAPLHSNDDFGGIVFKKNVLDDSTVDSNLDGNDEVDTKEIITNISIDMKGISDGITFDVEDNTGTIVGFKDVALNTNMPDSDGSETEYYILENDSTDNPTWIVENGLSIGLGRWIIEADNYSDATIKLTSQAGDGSLNLKVTGATIENDGDVSFNAKTFNINYTNDGSTPNSGGNSSVDDLPDSSNKVTITKNGDALEDTSFEVSASGTVSGFSYAYIFSPEITNDSGEVIGKIISNDYYKLPSGEFVTTDISSITVIPSADYAGELPIDIQIAQTDTSTGESYNATPTSTLTVDIAEVIDDSSIANINLGSELDGEWIDFEPQFSSSDTSGAFATEGLQSGSTVTFTFSGSVLVEGIKVEGSEVALDGDNSFTITINEDGRLPDIQIKPEAFKHGEISVDAEYNWADGAKVADHTDTFKINLDSEVDDISVENDSSKTTEATEGQELPLGITLNQLDSDGSEIASVVITGLPEGAVLSAGTIRTIDGEREFILKASEVADAKIIADPHFSGDFTVTAKAYSYDIKSSEISESDVVTKEFSITPVASGIKVDADGFGGDEDTAISIKLDLTLEDTDGSETLNVTLNGYEAGSTFTIDNGNTTCTNESETEGEYLITGLTPEQAESLAIIPPANYHGTMENITVSVQTVDGDSVLEEGVTDTFSIVVDSVVDSQSFEGEFTKDRVSYDESTETISVDGTDVGYVEELHFGSDTFNVIKGTSGDDNIEGTNEADMIFAGAGDDTIEGTSEDDVVYGGSGDDALLVEGELELDFTKVSSVETIDMSDNHSDDTLTMVNIDDMLDTNDDAIEIKGDDGDSIAKGADEPSTEVAPKEDGTKEISVPDGSLKAIVDESIDTSGFDDDTNAVS